MPKVALPNLANITLLYLSSRYCPFNESTPLVISHLRSVLLPEGIAVPGGAFICNVTVKSRTHYAWNHVRVLLLVGFCANRELQVPDEKSRKNRQQANQVPTYVISRLVCPDLYASASDCLLISRWIWLSRARRALLDILDFRFVIYYFSPKSPTDVGSSFTEFGFSFFCFWVILLVVVCLSFHKSVCITYIWG